MYTCKSKLTLYFRISHTIWKRWFTTYCACEMISKMSVMFFLNICFPLHSWQTAIFLRSVRWPPMRPRLLMNFRLRNAFLSPGYRFMSRCSWVIGSSVRVRVRVRIGLSIHNNETWIYNLSPAVNSTKRNLIVPSPRALPYVLRAWLGDDLHYIVNI